MQPEHETFLLEQVKKMGFIFIIDFLKEKFPKLSHEEACTIYDEFKAKHAEDDNVKEADSQLKQIGNELGNAIEQQIVDMVG